MPVPPCSTLVTAVSIPLSVVVALLALWTGDLSLNLLTLDALTIAIGRVVDDSIVVLENIKRHLGYGEDLRWHRRARVTAEHELPRPVRRDDPEPVAELPPGTSPEAKEKAATAVEQALAAEPSVETYQVSIGGGMFGMGGTATGISVTVAKDTDLEALPNRLRDKAPAPETLTPEPTP